MALMPAIKTITRGALLSALSVVVALSLAAGLNVAYAASIDLPGSRAYPESLSSSHDGTLYVGNSAEGGIVRIRPNTAPEQWIKPGAFGSASVLGVLVDERSSTLWACSNDLSSIGLTVLGGKAGSALLGFNLKTGAGKVRAAFPGDHNFCNDMAVGVDGSVYVTNSDAPQILRLSPNSKRLQVWYSNPAMQPAPGGYGLDGIAFGSNGSLYVNLFDAAELYRIDVREAKAGRSTKLTASRKLELTDALRPLRPGVFLLIAGAGRVDLVTVRGNEAAILTLGDGYVTPTGVTSVGDVAWVSEGQLDFMPDGTKAEGKPRLPFRLFSVALPK
jgi:sugar lactone lactonase YvrE